MKIVFLDESTLALDGDIDYSGFAALGEYEGYTKSTETETVARCADAEVVVSNKVPITAAFMDSLPRLRLVAVIATGYNNVDLDAAKARDIKVCNVAGYAENTVPQHTFALILNLATKVHLYHTDVQAGGWQASGKFSPLTYPVFELAGRILGIIGLGVIGRGVARIAEGFGMKVLANDFVDISGSGYENTPLDTLLGESDIVTVHTPLTEQTRDVIGAAEIAKMKRTALVINTARGGIVNEQALADALNSDRLAGAGFDVLSVEPPTDDNPLFSARNMIITPHTAWSAVEARQNLVDETIKNIRAFAELRERNIVV